MRVQWLLAAGGLGALAVAVALDPGAGRAAVDQDWTPFVLVSGLLLLGLVAGTDGLFDAAGHLVARWPGGGRSLLVAGALLVAVVTAVLNLDTAAAFLTPVLVVAARRRRTDPTPFLYLAVFLANGASLLLPGSNLTNLIVVGHGTTGTAFAASMALPWVAAVVTIPAVLALVFWRTLATPDAGAPITESRVTETAQEPTRRRRSSLGLAGVAVAVAVAAMLSLSGGTMALVVLASGVAVAVVRLAQGRLSAPRLRQTLGLPLLAGLFGLAVALGTLGRVWSGPQWLLAHASSWQAAAIGALVSAVVNNLPAASLLAARTPADPHALLIGLNLGPNLAVTGALSAFLWLQAARAMGIRPSARRFSALGLVVVPVSMAAALGALVAVR